MNVLKNDKQYLRLKQKGINLDRNSRSNFKKANHFTLINAYKPLFVKETKTIDDIKLMTSPIDTSFLNTYFGISSTYNYDNILQYLKKKYNINQTNNLAIESELRDYIKYRLHIYESYVSYNDFVRMNSLEHEMRNMLLKHVLHIENLIKSVFINTLSDESKESNFLINIKSYNVSSEKIQKSVTTISTILGKMNNDKSNAIRKKKEQKLIPPFWILVNEMTLKEVVVTISNFEEVIKEKVLDNIITKMTRVTTPNANHRKVLEIILYDLSDFRNSLAHNQPVYSYNSKIDYDIHGRILVDHIFKSYGENVSTLKILMINNLISFFGPKSFLNPSAPRLFQKNLAYYIFLLNSMTCNTEYNLKKDLKNVYSKYNLFGLPENGEFFDLNNFKNLIDQIVIENNHLNEIDYSLLKTDLGKLARKQSTNNVKSITDTVYKNIKNILNRIDKEYCTCRVYDDTFLFESKYKDFTGIDYNFLNNDLI